MPDKRLIALDIFEEESPGSTETWCQLMTGGGDRDSATENKPPNQGKRVKRCGKSTPADLVTDSAWKTPPRAKLSRDDIVRNNRKQSLASHQG